MTRDEARKELRMMVGGDADPYLSDADLDAILDKARRVDANGVGVGGDGYVDTFSMAWAAARGWRAKAAKASEYLAANVGGGTLPADQIYNHCVEMEDRYLKAVNDSASLAG